MPGLYSQKIVMGGGFMLQMLRDNRGVWMCYGILGLLTSWPINILQVFYYPGLPGMLSSGFIY